MSANPITNDAVDISSIPQAPGGGTVSGNSIEAVTNSSYDSSALFSSGSKARISGLSNATTFTNQSLAVFANTQQGVILKDQAGVTWGVKRNGKPVQIGGAVIDASQARKVVVTLSDNKVDNAGSKSAPNRFIPNSVSDSIKTGRFNTITELSKGADQYTGTTARDLAVLGKGDDRANLGKGDDLVAMGAKLGKKRVTLGQGKDRALLEEGALKSKGQVVITDFNSKQDRLIIEARASRVKGINSDTLKISTRNGTVRVVSQNDTFTRSSLEFLG